jgi:hypothetical protein
MDRNDCLDERFLDIACGVAFLLLAFFMMAMGVSFLPVIGVILSIPVLFLSWSFLSAPPPKGCAQP